MDADFELLEAWRGGDAKAGSQLFDRHFEAVRRFFRNKVGADRMEDLIQKTFLVMVEKRDEFRGDSSFRTYLFAIAHNVLRNAFRSHKRWNDRHDFATMSVHDLGPGPATIAAKRQERQILLLALRRIPIDYQVCLELFYWEGMEGKELAEVLDLPLGTVKSRLRLGKQKLEKAIQELSASPDQLNQTLTNLESWARELRAEVIPVKN